jgi:2-amino-4-hydroxy-6-hydroxymethyldihydropteridine diphosphokinase
MAHVFLSLGSNLGDRLLYLRRAIIALSNLPSCHILKVSPVYETEPVSSISQPSFLNLVLAFETGTQPLCLLSAVKAIEVSVGRTASPHWGPREIDIDILLYDDLVVTTEVLSIPHPEMHRRRFVLVPLADIAPDIVHPMLRLPVRELLLQCEDKHWVRPFVASLAPFV